MIKTLIDVTFIDFKRMVLGKKFATIVFDIFPPLGLCTDSDHVQILSVNTFKHSEENLFPPLGG